MNRINQHLDQVNWIAQLADLKQAQYHNSLLISTLIELLVEKGIMTAPDIANMSIQLDASFTPNPIDASSNPHPTNPSFNSQPLDPLFNHPIEPSLTPLPADPML